MGGFKRSLMAAGLLATTGVDLAADAYFFSVPSPSLVANNMAARRAVRTDAIQPSPSPRMATMSPPETASRLSSGSGVVVGGGSPPGVIIDSVVSRSPLVAGVLPAGVESAKRGRDDGKSPDFEVNLGKVISVLREDYPRIFFDAPSFDIFTDEIELRDPTGVAFRGIVNYKRVFSTLRFFRQVLMNDASTTFRLTYDWSKQQVRVTWSFVLQLKARQRPIHVDGISAYHINSEGLAYRHELETVIVNGTPVEPPYAYAWINLPAWVSRGAGAGAGVMPAPNGIVAQSSSRGVDVGNGRGLELDMGVGALLSAARTDPGLREEFMSTLNVLMASEGSENVGAGGEAEGGGAAEGGSGGGDDEEGATAPASKQKKKVREIKGKKKQGWFGLQENLECDTSFDCTGGMVCCDFLLVKVCCSNGIRQPKFGDLIPSLVPIPGRGRNENDTPVRRPRSRTTSEW